MALSYDFDIFDVIPPSDSGDNLVRDLLAHRASNLRPEGATVALFRDEATAEALSTAPPALRDYFLASGFGLNTYASGAPRGFYPAQDEQERLAIICRLTENARTHDLPAPEDFPEGGCVFRLGEFLAELTSALPVPTPDVAAEINDADSLHGTFPTGLPRYFETDPLPPTEVCAAPAPPPRKFWQNRMVQMALVAGLVFGAIHLVNGPPLTVLASL